MMKPEDGVKRCDCNLRHVTTRSTTTGPIMDVVMDVFQREIISGRKRAGFIRIRQSCRGEGIVSGEVVLAE